MNYAIPDIFKPFPELTAGFIGRGDDTPSLNLNDLESSTTRATFHNLGRDLGFAADKVIATYEVHGAGMAVVPPAGYGAEADAQITAQPGYLLTIRMADCIAIMLYDPTTHTIANIHSGWKGTAADIPSKTVAQMVSGYNCDPAHIYAYMGPTMDPAMYEFGQDLATEHFDSKYFLTKQHDDAEKIYLDYGQRVYDQLLEAGLTADHIERDLRSTFHEKDLHSFRRDSTDYAHNIAFIGLKN